MVKQLFIDEAFNLNLYDSQIKQIKEHGIELNNRKERNSFSIYIGNNEIECEKHSLAYILNKELPYYSNKTTSIFCENALETALKRVLIDFYNIDKKVLLYLGKFPEFGFDVDGGSILARQLIDSLKIRCKLDLVFIRKNKEVYQDEFVHSIRYVEYKDAFNNKFVRRLENLDTNLEALKNYEQYNKVITAHVSKFFGIKPDDNSFWNRAILFPMFCTSSYKRAGENVLEEYTELESIVIKNVSKIITPSKQEQKDLLNDYECNKSRISVIPRGINPLIKFKQQGKLGNRFKIVYIGSIKPQKNNIDALHVLNELINKGYQAEMHFICTIQDKSIYEDMENYIHGKNLEQYVFFHFEVSQSDMPEILDNMDINISVSNWETFGRGIFEGISAGLPTFVLEHLEVVKEICADNIGVRYSKSYKEMASEIIHVCNDSELYLQMHNALKTIARTVSYKNEQQRLLKAIFD